MRRALAIAVLSLGLTAWACPDEVRWAIEGEIMRSLEATRAEDINAYMDGVAPDLRIRQDDGSVLDRDGLRADVLQQWAIIEKTHLLETTIDRMRRRDTDEWVVWTSQRWDRTMIGRDGVSRHRVVTTQKHRELWRRRGVRWYAYEIQELGGELWIDGVKQG